MLTRTLRAGAAAIGSAVLATTILTGCAGPKITLQGMEVTSLDKAIESADAAWAQKRASGTAANVDRDSRCYAQTSNDVLVEQAICGPIHYLGDDEQVWETMDWQPSGEGKDKVQVSATSSFSEGTRAPNATLYRADGKQAPENLVVPEPDTKAADATQAIWGLNLGSDGTEDSKTTVVTPESEIVLSRATVSDRLGDASNRVKAGDGNKFGSVNIEVRSTEPTSFSGDTSPVLTELAFTSGGKSYPLGKAKSGSVAMAVPGDGADLALAVTYEGLTQSLGLSDSKLQTKATAFYDSFRRETQSSQPPEKVQLGADDSKFVGYRGTFEPAPVQAKRTAYDPKLGWATAGKAWLVVEDPIAIDANYHGTDGSWGSYSAYYDNKVTVASATVKNISGAAFTAKSKRSEVSTEDTWDNRSTVTIVFEVPADTGDFSLDFGIKVSGAKKSSSEDVAPASLNLDAAFKGIELIFDKTK